ncbi:MAG: mandelate racemase/muconate lactonizing enzyme family protein [Pseudomonadota bacterium]|nr:mandelate racemase/muconate lactonizing enzyme family protein [Pseudomonadota bacterium]
MKIISVTAHPLRTELETPFAFSQGWVRARSATLVEVRTDDGLVGWGEAFCQGLEVPEISATIIRDCLAEMIIGENPLDTERLWFAMYNRSRDFGRKGSVMAAISAIDTALWDIAGKAYGKPVWQLLGGAFRREVEPYATGFYRIGGKGEAGRLVEEAHQHRERGFRFMKVKIGFGVEDDIEVMNAIHAALEGSGVTLMVDANHAYGRVEAVYLGEAMAHMGLRWFEEPVVPEDLDSYAHLRTRLPMAIAGGENEHGLYGFNALFRAGAVDIAQPDIGSCGGITGMRHIAALAQASGIEVNPHVWGSAVAQAASLQVIAALPDANHALFARQPILEYDQSAHPFRNELTTAPMNMENGLVAISGAPGLGIEVRQDTIEAYRI